MIIGREPKLTTSTTRSFKSVSELVFSVKQSLYNKYGLDGVVISVFASRAVYSGFVTKCKLAVKNRSVTHSLTNNNCYLNSSIVMLIANISRHLQRVNSTCRIHQYDTLKHLTLVTMWNLIIPRSKRPTIVIEFIKL